MKNKISNIELNQALLDKEIVVDGNCIRLSVDNDNYFIRAELNGQTFSGCVFGEDAIEKDLTSDQLDMVYNLLLNYKEEDNTAFTNQDYDHFESLIHS